MTNAEPIPKQVAQALKGIKAAAVYATSIWSYPNGEWRVKSTRGKYYNTLGKAIHELDPEYSAYDSISDHTLIEMHTRLLWLYSQFEPAEAATLYKAFVTRLYQLDYGLTAEKAVDGLRGKEAGQLRDEFEQVAIQATDENDAWKFITEDAQARNIICEQAITVTTMMIGVPKDGLQEDGARKLWGQRELWGM